MSRSIQSNTSAFGRQATVSPVGNLPLDNNEIIEIIENGTTASLSFSPINLPATLPDGDSVAFATRTKAKNFIQSEDELLVCCYLNVGQDPVIGNQQRGNSFWRRVHEQFVAYDKVLNHRSQNQLNNRWLLIQKLVNKFCGVYGQVLAQNQSGIN